MLAKSKAQKSPFLPEATRAALTSLPGRAGGALLMALAIAGLLALASFNGGDPTPNQVTDQVPLNILGIGGAYTADILLQTMGLASIVLALALMFWSLSLVRRGQMNDPVITIIALPPTVFLLAAALAHVPTISGWPINTGYGGFAGMMVRELGDTALFALTDRYLPLWAGGALYFVLGGALLPTALGLDLAERAAFIRLGITALRALGWPFRLLWSKLQVRPRDGSAILVKRERRKKRVRKDPLLRSTAPKISTPSRARRSDRASRERQRTMDLGEPRNFNLPTLDMLAKVPRTNGAEKLSRDALQQNARLLESVLDDFGVKGDVTRVRPGPVVTLYELEPAPGTKSARVIGLADDIARSMSAVSARVAVVSGRNAIGIELPNSRHETVYLRDILSSEAYETTKARLPLALGKEISGAPKIVDLANMPHILVAGTTGSGKSVGLNAMILSLLYRLPPDQCKFIMVDPKMLELSVYEGIPHLLTPVVTEPKKAVVALKWAVREMEERYHAMSKIGVRNISAYNKRVAKAHAEGKTISRRIQTGFDRESGQPIFERQEFDFNALPLIVVVIDEMADLMLVAGKDVEASVQRLSQMARAAGIHLIMATQRPSVDVITGTIKANFPTRISFQVTSKIDSRTILGEQGAEQLLGHGDMLYMSGGGRLTRVHGPFVTDREVEVVVNHLKRQGAPEYLAAVTEEVDEDLGSMLGGNAENELYRRAVEVVHRDGKASTSYIQRRLKIGYNRAATLIEEMEAQGIVSAPNHAGRREVLVSVAGD